MDRRIWYPNLEEAGVQLTTLHQSRHTFATLILGSGENPEWVAEMLGHSTIRMLQKYSKFIPNLTRQDGSAFMKVFLNDVADIVKYKGNGEGLGVYKRRQKGKQEKC